MEENNRKGPGVCYAVMGVATLVVAIIGATFAYFSATVEPNANTVKGQTAASSNVTLSVAPIYPTEVAKQGTSGRMLPMNDSDLETALGKKCMADDGYVACQVYKVTLENKGSEDVYAKSQLTLSVGTIEHMKWSRMESQDVATGAAIENVTEANRIGVNETETITAGGKAEMYFVVWLSNINDNQAPKDAGQQFTGTVTAKITNSTVSATTGMTATFTQGA